MYEAHFGLHEPPFSITPDPKFLYLSRGHRDALAYLHYGIEERKGFLVLCGEVGVGKTLVIRTLLGQLPDEVETAIVMNARLNFRQLLYLALVDFGLQPPGRSKVQLLLCLQEFLLRLRDRRGNAVLIVDEAQNLTEEALEDFRLLSNLEAANTKLVQILLVGQPELRRLLALPSLRQLRQRIPGIFDLPRLTPDATTGYVDFRLSVAGKGNAAGLFTEDGLDEICLRSEGIPRLINQVCDRSLLVAYAKGADRVRREHVREAAEELEIGGVGAPAARFLWQGAKSPL
jgi:general secretion pathway protein A